MKILFFAIAAAAVVATTDICRRRRRMKYSVRSSRGFHRNSMRNFLRNGIFIAMPVRSPCYVCGAAAAALNINNNKYNAI